MRDATVGLNLEGVLLALALLSALYWLGVLVCTAAFARRRPAGPGWTPPVSVLKPLLKDDGHLYDNLRSFCAQDYPVFEVLFGVQDEHDPAVRVVKRLIHEFPQRDLRLIVNPKPCWRIAAASACGNPRDLFINTPRVTASGPTCTAAAPKASDVCSG